MARTEKIDIFYEKTHDGAWLLSTITNNRGFWRRYYYYTKQEATKRFRQYVKEQTNS